MSEDLASRTCVPCKGGVEPMSRQQAEQHLREVPGWQLDDEGRRISRRFKFRNFQQALAFVQTVGLVAEQQDHHPDIRFGWGYAEVEVHTHKIGGLHENDFILAAKVNQLAEAE